jgi:hypothetical protein
MTTTAKEKISYNHKKEVLILPQIKPEAMSRQPTAEETMKGLADVNREFNALRDSMPEAEWEKRLSAALRDMQ